MNGIAHKSRIVLIEIGKQLPFVFCFILAISYIECVYALVNENFVVLGNEMYLKKPISWFFGGLFEYSMQFIVLATIISFAIRACKWNKLAILYLACQLAEKSYFQTHEFASYEIYYLVSFANIAICVFLVFKGIKNL